MTFISLFLLLALHSAQTVLAENIPSSKPLRTIRGVADGYGSDSVSNSRNTKIIDSQKKILRNGNSHYANEKYQNSLAHPRRQQKLPRNLEGGGLFPEDFFRNINRLKKPIKDKKDKKGGVFGKKHTKKKGHYGKGSSGTSGNLNANSSGATPPTPSPVSNGPGLIQSSLNIASGSESIGSVGSPEGGKNSKKDKPTNFFDSNGDRSSSDSSNGNVIKDGEEAISPTASPVDNDPTQAPFITDLINSGNNNDGNFDPSLTAPPISGADTIDAENTEGVEDDGDAKSDGNDDNNDATCLAVSSQEPPEATIGSSATEFLFSVDIVYETDAISSADIGLYLDGGNIAMALWIAGCENEAISALAVDENMGTRRKLQDEMASIIPGIITYSEASFWETNSE